MIFYGDGTLNSNGLGGPEDAGYKNKQSVQMAFPNVVSEQAQDIEIVLTLQVRGRDKVN